MNTANPTTNNTLHTTIPHILRLRIGPLLGGKDCGSSVGVGGDTGNDACVGVSSGSSHNIPFTTWINTPCSMSSMGCATINDSFRSSSEEGCVSSPLLREAVPWPTAIAPGGTGARLSCLMANVLVGDPPPVVCRTLETFLTRSMKSSGTLSPPFVSSRLVE